MTDDGAPEGHDTRGIAHGMNLMPHPITKLLVGRCGEEIEFEKLQIEED